MQARDRPRSLLKWLLFAGLVLVLSSVAYQVGTFVTTFSALGNAEISSEQKQTTLSSSIHSAMAAKYVTILGGLLVAVCAPALIMRRLAERRSSESNQRGE
jgi:hypothetical protein